MLTGAGRVEATRKIAPATFAAYPDAAAGRLHRRARFLDSIPVFHCGYSHSLGAFFCAGFASGRVRVYVFFHYVRVFVLCLVCSGAARVGTREVNGPRIGIISKWKPHATIYPLFFFYKKLGINAVLI